jgi:hypothetical protein
MAGDFRRGEDGPRKDDMDFRKPEYRDDAPRQQPQADDGDGDCGGQVIGWIVFIAIFGGINLITYNLFGIVFIPIRR